MKVGDTIKCYDIDDLLNTMKELALNDIDTDFFTQTAKIYRD